MKNFYVYILSSQRNGTLYIGVTSNLMTHMQQHKSKMIKGFTRKYGVDRLVYYEIFESICNAIAREKQLKEWKREWKLRLIEKVNPQWKDLCEQSLDPGLRRDDV